MANLTSKLVVLIVLLLPEVNRSCAYRYIYYSMNPFGMQPSSAAYVLSVRTYTYRNDMHRGSNGDCCDYYLIAPTLCVSSCDNIFVFCLRGANVRDDDSNNCPLGREEFRIYSDNITFPLDDSSIRSFSSQDPWTVS